MSPTVTFPILFQLLLKRCMACCMSIFPTMSWEGPLPNSTAFQEAHIEALQGNKGLCGNVIELQPCRVGHISKREIKSFSLSFSLFWEHFHLYWYSLEFSSLQKENNKICMQTK